MRVMAMSLILGLALSASARAADLKVGDPAPNFKLQATDGKTYQLSDFKGKKAVVVAWFPAAFTRGCTIECKSLAENGHLIKAYDATYFMISTDTVEDQTKFAKANSVTLGQGDKAQQAYQMAEQKKLEEWDRIERQMPDTFQLQVFTHTTSQNRAW